jgi:N-acetylmuramate 1-kinase
MIGPLLLTGEQATARLAQDLAMMAAPGWTIQLVGDLGAGKTSFARAFIRALARDEGLEVPSPTYTLVQRYEEAVPPVLHADLYRITSPGQVDELGLDEREDGAIALIEWPQHAGADAFARSLILTLEPAGHDARSASLDGPPDLLATVTRTLKIRAFLESNGLGESARARLQGDASSRRYETLDGMQQPLILMDAPRMPDGPIIADGKPYSQLVHLAESVHAFVAVGSALKARGFASPAIHAQDLESGLLVLEDMGRQTILTHEGTPDPSRYKAAVELLGRLHSQTWPDQLAVGPALWHSLNRYDGTVMGREISLCPDWYVAHRGLAPERFDRTGFLAAWQQALAPFEQEPATLTIRDYHSPNIIWRQGESGDARIGIIDFQDALLGPPAYDVASLVQDARVTIPPDLQGELLAAYGAARRQAGATDFDQSAFEARFALISAQRNTKLLGIFARLNVRDGKPAYLAHLPRVEAYMAQLLRHEVLRELKPYYDQLLPVTQ